jgi:hypothetical protein
MEACLSSSQAFVRALKASTDPPTEDAPTKINRGREAWQRKQFLVANKAELITEWLLGKMLKERGYPL